MHVLWWLGNGRRGSHVVEGVRYPDFADMWNFIMREPAILVPFEGLCRMEAAAHLRPALPAHEWSSRVLKGSAEAEDRAQLRAMEPGLASSSKESDEQTIAAQRWLRREVKENAKRCLASWVGPVKTSAPADVPMTVKLPLDDGDEDDSATREEGDEEDGEEEEEEAEPQREEEPNETND